MTETPPENIPIFAPCADSIEEVEFGQPKVLTVLKVIWCSISGFFVERAGQIILSAFLLLMLWGTHGRIELLRFVWPDWRGLGSDIATRPPLIPGIPWDHELISFWGGALLVVIIPILLIKFVYKRPLSEFGLGLPPKDRRRLALLSFVLLTVVCLPAFVIGANDASMQAVYPFYRPFDNIGQFALYEITYLPFFIAIEFIFRGYLLFGLAGIQDYEIQVKEGGANRLQRFAAQRSDDDKGIPGVFFFARYALLIQMLSYTAWHLGKPVPELWGTLVWGLGAGAVAYAVRSLWPVVLSHWVLNIVLDILILQNLGLWF